MVGKVCLITGGTNGIGLVTAESLANEGAVVVLVGRDAARAEAAAAQIEKNAGRAVEYLLGDLSTQAEVRRVAEAFRLGSAHSSPHHRLDVLINNAGALFMEQRMSADGIEMTFALNHLAYFLLTLLLLDLLKASAPSRVINVSSAAHFGGKINFDDLRSPRSYNAWRAYSQSKLANVLFTRELARRLEGSGVTANALHPGYVATNFGISNGGIFRSLFRLGQIAAISPEKGAQTSIYLATSAEVEGVTGRYFDRSKPARSSGAAQDDETARRLWQVSLEMTGLSEETG
jgi:NAD(P)-dependent dehydrogenase (short-subunit alcohol dehydrogenase family)